MLEPGTGGSSTSQWLEDNFSDYLGEYWTDGQNPEQDMTDAFLQVGSNTDYEARLAVLKLSHAAALPCDTISTDANVTMCQADKALLASKKGFLGKMGERGIGLWST